MPPFDRRSMLATGFTGLGLTGLGVVRSPAAEAGSRPRPDSVRAAATLPAAETGLAPGTERDQTAALQAAIDRASESGAAVELPPGRFHIGAVQLRPGTRLIGSRRTSRIVFTGGMSFLSATGADDIWLEGLVLDGGGRPLMGETTGLISLTRCRSITLRDLAIEAAGTDGIVLTGCSGRIRDCAISLAHRTGIRSLDANPAWGGLDIDHNVIADCGDNGIQVWRSELGEDGTRVANNRVERVRAASGGSGENGNGISVFRAAGVLVTGNRIADCAYSAIRGNAASDIQMVANSCTRLGEVALYAEFGFEGALISSNLVDTAATGISVTNFNEGGRLAAIQGNLIRNLFRREHEKADKRGEGIGVEADAAVTGNTIEGAPTAGIAIGFGRYMRDVTATGNLIRNSRVGITIASDPAAGPCFISGNMISGSRDGAIRASDHGRLFGPDLAKEPTVGRVTITGNAAV